LRAAPKVDPNLKHKFDITHITSQLWFCFSKKGWIQHDLVGGGGGGALPALVPSCVGHVCRPPINLLHYCKVLLDYCIWIVIVVHSSLIIMLLLKLLYLILSLIFFALSWKIAPPWPGLGGGGCTHVPPHHSKSIPVSKWKSPITNLESKVGFLKIVL
jgi:hypothetical protein